MSVCKVCGGTGKVAIDTHTDLEGVSASGVCQNCHGSGSKVSESEPGKGLIIDDVYIICTMSLTGHCPEVKEIEAIKRIIKTARLQTLEDVWLKMCEDCKHMGTYNNDTERQMICHDKRNIPGLCWSENCPLIKEIKEGL